MFKKIAVFGTGAIGSSTAADLTDAGYDVTIVDQWPAHVETMKTSGFDIQMPDLDLKIPAKALHLCELASVKPAFDLILLGVKSYAPVGWPGSWCPISRRTGCWWGSRTA